MGIDYAIDHDCAAKQALGTPEIVELLKDRSRAEMVLSIAREQGDERPPSEISFQVHTIGPGGEPEPHEVNVQSLLDGAAALDQHAAGCEGCPANVIGQPYGCVGYVSYPIEPESEAWLLERLPADVESTAGQLLCRATEDFGWREGQAAELRTQGEMFFRTTELQSRRWGDDLSLDSNQVFNMVFGLGHLGSSHCRMLALFFGIVEPNIDLGELMDLGDDDLIAAARSAELASDAGGQIGALDRALRSIAIAAAVDADFLLDG